VTGESWSPKKEKKARALVVDLRRFLAADQRS
jgi:hypothetical protein